MAPAVALVLGGGGARGLAHVPMIEAFDDLGVRPAAVAGTSMGALVGAAYASGLSGRDIRDLATATLRNRRGLWAGVRAARTGRFADLFSGLGNPVAIDAQALCDALLPGALAATFEACAIPLSVSATDFYARRETVFRSGPLRPAVAASICLPGLFRPVEIDGRVLVDGGATNPLPLDHVAGQADFVVAVDVTGGPVPPRSGAGEPLPGLPGSWEALSGTLQILQGSVVTERLARHPPDLLIRPDVDLFRVLDFMRASVIFRLALPAKEALKRQLAALLETA